MSDPTRLTKDLYTTGLTTKEAADADTGIGSYTLSGLCTNGVPTSFASTSSGILSITTGTNGTRPTFALGDTIPTVFLEVNTAFTNFYKALYTYVAWVNAGTTKTNIGTATSFGFDYSKRYDKSDFTVTQEASQAATDLASTYNLAQTALVKLQYMLLLTQNTTNAQTQRNTLTNLQKELDGKLRDLQGGPLSRFADMPEQLDTSMYTGLFWSVLAVSAVFVAFTQLG